jgi:hypothetical protein
MTWSAFTAATAVALAAMVSAAHAAEVTGRISGIDDTAHRITLSDGHTYALAAMPGAAYFAGFNDNLHVGERVRLQENGGIVTGISPL